jgi:hypothetical protein
MPPARTRPRISSSRVATRAKTRRSIIAATMPAQSARDRWAGGRPTTAVPTTMALSPERMTLIRQDLGQGPGRVGERYVDKAVHAVTLQSPRGSAPSRMGADTRDRPRSASLVAPLDQDRVSMSAGAAPAGGSAPPPLQAEMRSLPRRSDGIVD